MSDAKFHLVARASILASGDTDDFHHVAPDEVVLVSVEALERVTRERDEETRKRYATEKGLVEMTALATKAESDAARLREALVESREAQHKASLERDAHHREEVVLRAEVERLRGLIRDAEFAAGGYIMGNPCCPWCEGLVGKTHRDDCPAFSARGEVRR